MKHTVKLKLSNSRKQIKIYKYHGDSGKLEHIDTEYTDASGLLTWMPPTIGVYAFINDAQPEYNISGYSYTLNGGRGEGHGILVV